MATITLNWTPVNDANSNDQLVQRKTFISSFATIATLSASASTYVDNTASDNTYYTYQIINNCKVGGPTDSVDAVAAKPVCPTVSETVAGVEVSLSFPNLTEELVYQGNVVIDGGIGTYSTSDSQTGQVINFTGAFSTTYNYTFTVAVGEFTSTCTGSVTTEDAPACPAPTGLSATVS